MKMTDQCRRNMPGRRISGTGGKLFVIVVALVSYSFYFAACGGGKPEEAIQEAATPDPIAQPTAVKFDFPDKDYSKFDHQSEQHVRLPCLVCHTTEGESAKVKFTGHIPCSSCHVEHFEQKDHAICSICHTDNQTGEMKSFPRLTSHNARFSHSIHRPHANCATCHSPTDRGIGFSVPARANAHSTCFQCHGSNTEIAKAEVAKGKNIDNCSTCHQTGRPDAAWQPATYSGSFSHAKHSGKGMNCSSCHTVLAGGGSRQVTAPVTAMHLASGRAQSCATCHNGKRAFGGEDFTNCKRCHQGSSFDF